VGLFVVIAWAPCGQAANSPIPHGTVELIAENKWITAGHTVNVGLHFQLEKGWHIYWINPGDSGEPPRVKWQLPTGLTAGDIEWPAPQRLGTSSIIDFGYAEGTMLIVPMHADAHLGTHQPAQLAAQVSVLVCHEICIPGKAHLSLALPIKSEPPATDSQTEGLFASTRRSLPRSAPLNWKLGLAEANGSFVLTASIGRQVNQAAFYPLVESQIDNAAPQKLLPTANGFRLTLRKSDQLLKSIDRLKGVLVLSTDHAYLIDVKVSKSAAATNS
jgi:DsbC/DsbD-like thiol-disulfide interchange protein